MGLEGDDGAGEGSADAFDRLDLRDHQLTKLVHVGSGDASDHVVRPGDVIGRLDPIKDPDLAGDLGRVHSGLYEDVRPYVVGHLLPQVGGVFWWRIIASPRRSRCGGYASWMVVDQASDVRRELDEVRQRLTPAFQRAWAIARLDELFRAGRAPDPLPDGFLSGALLTTSVAGAVDALARRVAGLWMPWLGKSFAPSTNEGLNVLTSGARAPMRALWPSYVPERELADRLEAFPFRTRVAPGELDGDVTVLKIDYDFEANPDLLIRRILDELVQVADGLYLGKILLRRRSKWQLIGFFSLEK